MPEQNTQDARLKAGIDLAIRLGLHRLTSRAMGERLRRKLDACPKCEFEGLEEGGIYHVQTYRGGASWLIRIIRVTPSRKQAVASIDYGPPRRIYRGDYSAREFSRLTSELLALAPIAHRMVILSAIGAGLEVPAIVRRQYPELFIEAPERFARDNESAEKRVEDALACRGKSWGGDRCAQPADIDEWIEEAHRQIAKLQDARCRAVALNPDVDGDYDEYIDAHRADVDFYRWLRRTVDVGGVFYVEEREERQEES